MVISGFYIVLLSLFIFAMQFAQTIMFILFSSQIVSAMKVFF